VTVRPAEATLAAMETAGWLTRTRLPDGRTAAEAFAAGARFAGTILVPDPDTAADSLVSVRRPHDDEEWGAPGTATRLRPENRPGRTARTTTARPDTRPSTAP